MNRSELLLGERQLGLGLDQDAPKPSSTWIGLCVPFSAKWLVTVQRIDPEMQVHIRDVIVSPMKLFWFWTLVSGLMVREIQLSSMALPKHL